MALASISAYITSAVLPVPTDAADCSNSCNAEATVCVSDVVGKLAPMISAECGVGTGGMSVGDTELFRPLCQVTPPEMGCASCCHTEGCGPPAMVRARFYASLTTRTN